MKGSESYAQLKMVTVWKESEHKMGRDYTGADAAVHITAGEKQPRPFSS